MKILVFGLILAELWLSASCPDFLTGVKKGMLEHAAINEVSGIVASRRRANTFWVHNDSGDTARIYALDQSGKLLVTVDLGGAEAIDYEDIAAGPGPQEGRPYLYVGDIGDNGAKRARIVVYRFIEPDPLAATTEKERLVVTPDTIKLRFPDGPRDAETLLVDPLTRDIYVISKRETPSKVYRAPYPQSVDQVNLLELTGTLPWGWAVAGDISPDGRLILVKGYFNAGVWRRDPAKPLALAFAQRQCQVFLREEPQGEAIGFAGDGCGFFTLSEGRNQPLYFYPPMTPCEGSPKKPRP